MQAVIAADAEAAFLDWLRALLMLQPGPTPHVASRLPPDKSPTPPESVLIFRTGGAMATIRTDRPQLTVEVRAKTETRAAALAALVRGLLLAAGRDGVVLAGHQLYSVTELSGPGNLPDPVTRQVRYTWSIQAHIAGTVVDLD